PCHRALCPTRRSSDLDQENAERIARVDRAGRLERHPADRAPAGAYDEVRRAVVGEVGHAPVVRLAEPEALHASARAPSHVEDVRSEEHTSELQSRVDL